MSGQRKHIFTAGPAVLPVEVLETLSESVRDYKGLGQSVLELSHRSEAFDEIHDKAEQGLRRLLSLKAEDQVLFLQGGATTQFSMVPMNYLRPNHSADYVLTGTWSVKALAEAKRVGQARIAASSKEQGFCSLPSNFDWDSSASYVHYTSNNTIFGTQWAAAPVTERPLVCDASSDIFSRPLDCQQHALVYAGAQKNAGPSGVTIVIIRADFFEQLSAEARDDLGIMFNYRTHAAKQSRYNTPPTFAIYAVSLVAEWLEQLGGLEAMAARNQAKAKKLYEAIDSLEAFEGVAATDARSLMNVTFRLRDDSQQARFLEQAEQQGLVGLKGHRSVGGLRASLYNALPPESVDTLVAFMKDFAQNS